MGVELVYFADASDAFPDQRPGSIGPVGPENFPSHISRGLKGTFYLPFLAISYVCTQKILYDGIGCALCR